MVNEDEILKGIDVYIKEQETDYAVMINGKWGIGKTFFVKQRLMEHIQHTFSIPVIYNSLFGVSSIDELWQTIALQIADYKMNEIGNKKYYSQTKHKLPLKLLDNNGAGLTARVFKGLLGIVPKGKNINDIFSTLLKESIDFKHYVYVFDDLERVGNGIDIKSILGVMDILANQSGAKVILVCNEAFFYIEKSINGNSEDEKKKERVVDFVIKSEYKDYGEFKEKIIGVTYDYVPNLQNILEYFINRQEDKLKTFLKSNLGLINECLIISRCKNIRTIRFIFKRYSELYLHLFSLYKTINLEMEYCDNFFMNLLESTIYTSVSLKEYSKLPVYTDGSLSILTFFGENGVNTEFKYWSMRRTYVSYKPLDRYLESYIFEEKEFRQIIQQYINGKKNTYTEYSEPLKEIFTTSDENALTCLKEYEEKIRCNEIPVNAYPKIIEQLYEMSSVLGETDLQEQYEKLMIDNIEAPGAVFDIEQWYGTSGFLKYSKNAYDRILVKMKKVKSRNKDIKLKSLFEDSENFVINLGEYLNSFEGAVYSTGKIFLGNLDGTKVANIILGLDTIDLNKTRELFAKIYPDYLMNIDECYAEDKDFLNSLIDKLKDGAQNVRKDKIWNEHLKLLYEYLESIVKKL